MSTPPKFQPRQWSDSTPSLVEGAMWLDQNRATLYFDLNGVRTPVDGIIYLQNQLQRESLWAPIENKLYFLQQEGVLCFYDGTNWVNIYKQKLSQLKDVDVDDVSDGQALVWDAEGSKWTGRRVALTLNAAATGELAQLEGAVEVSDSQLILG